MEKKKKALWNGCRHISSGKKKKKTSSFPPLAMPWFLPQKTLQLTIRARSQWSDPSRHLIKSYGMGLWLLSLFLVRHVENWGYKHTIRNEGLLSSPFATVILVIIDNFFRNRLHPWISFCRQCSDTFPFPPFRFWKTRDRWPFDLKNFPERSIFVFVII